MQPTLGNAKLTRLILASAALLACSVIHAQDLRTYLLAARRSGAIEIIDPASLSTIGRIHFDLPPKSVGLNGVSASADGATLYVEGPIPKTNGCCLLYAVDLATFETKEVADIPGTASRAAFVTSDGITYPAAALRGKAPRFSGKDWWPKGIWMDDRFLYYDAKADGSSGRLRSISPNGTLSADVSVEPFAKVPGCSSYMETGLAGAADNVFLYEMFGWIGDCRTSCSGVPGGAWIVDPDGGRLLDHVAPDLYFSELVVDPERGELYGISVYDPNWRGGVELVRMDAQDGTIPQSRVLESDFWRIASAPLRSVPQADVRALTSVKK